MSDPQFSTRSGDSPRELVVVARGEVDLASVPALAAELEAALSHRPAVVTVDLAAVTFIDSSGVNVLVQARRQAGEETRLALRAPSEACRRVLAATGLDDIFGTHD